MSHGILDEEVLIRVFECRHLLRFDFGLIFQPLLDPKSLQDRLQSGFRSALNEDSVSKLQKEKAELRC